MRTKLAGLRDLACHLGVVGAVLGGLGLIVALHPREEPPRAGAADPEHARDCPICRSPYRFERRGPGLLAATEGRSNDWNSPNIDLADPRGDGSR